MTVEGSCHCGAVRLAAPSEPDWVVSCNCSICRKLGTLMAYYPDGLVAIEGETRPYIWGDRMIGLHHCPVCGCATHWRTLGEDFGKMGVNARLFDGFAELDERSRVTVGGRPVDIRFVDNAD